MAKTRTRVRGGSETIRGRPKISASWMPGRAAGLRARPSAAAAVALACAMPQPADAIAMEKPAVIATQLVTPASPPCANAGTAKQNADKIRNREVNLRMALL